MTHCILALFLALQAPPADKGTVQGLVFSAGTNQPLSGVTVRLSGGPADPQAVDKLLGFFATRGVVVSPPPAGQLDDRFLQNLSDTAAARGLSLVNPEVQNAIGTFVNANRSRFTTVSDNAGRFAINGVPPGRYVVESERPDHFGPSSGLPDPARAPVTASVTAGAATEVQISMTPGAVIAGRVSNAAGRRLADVEVHAFSIVYQNGFPVLLSAASALTDDHGDYRLFWLSPGEYLVAALPKPAIAAVKQPVRTFYPGTADVLMARPVVVRGGDDASGFDIELQTAAPFKISGEIVSSVPPPTAPAVVGANVGPTTATITILSHDPSVPDNVASRTLGAVTLTPIGDGKSSAHFEVDGIMPGSYDISTWMRESNPDGGSSITIARAPVEVRDQDVTGVVLNVYPSVRVYGNASVDGHPPGRVTVRVSLQPDGSQVKVPVYQGIGARAVVANGQDGSFMVPAVTSGRFRVQIGAGLPQDVYVADVLQGGISIYDSGFDVAGRSPNPIEVLLRSGAASIEGTVQDSSGRPMANAAVVLVPPPMRRQNRALYRSGTTDAGGHFSIRGVAPENYRLFAWQRVPPGAYFNERFLSKYEDRGRAVSIGQASTLNVTINAIPAEAR